MFLCDDLQTARINRALVTLPNQAARPSLPPVLSRQPVGHLSILFDALKCPDTYLVQSLDIDPHTAHIDGSLGAGRNVHLLVNLVICTLKADRQHHL